MGLAPNLLQMQRPSPGNRACDTDRNDHCPREVSLRPVTAKLLLSADTVSASAKANGHASAPGMDKAQDLSAYRQMLLIRRFEEKAGQLYGMGFIGGFCHLYIGQEAVVIGMQMALKPGDQVITGYRDHGHMQASMWHGGQGRDG